MLKRSALLAVTVFIRVVLAALAGVLTDLAPNIVRRLRVRHRVRAFHVFRIIYLVNVPACRVITPVVLTLAREAFILPFARRSFLLYVAPHGFLPCSGQNCP
jgi:hypothetical protein